MRLPEAELTASQYALFAPFPAATHRPFLKWAGGKQQLLHELLERCPSRFNRYFEPFLGSGALFFGLHPRKAFLSDANEELLTAFEVVRDHVNALIRLLPTYKNTRASFLRIRAQDVKTLSKLERAARMIYLNRTCFNGLYRVNRKGRFNTPYGANKRATICNRTGLLTASDALQGTSLRACDYRQSLRSASRGDFIYLDPPYIPVGRFADFKRYHHEPFGREQHEQLARDFADLDERGCHVMLSNSSCEESLRLYKRWNVSTVMARRLINKNGSGRGAIAEILVTNY
jgi:DNA adenine methylase